VLVTKEKTVTSQWKNLKVPILPSDQGSQHPHWDKPVSMPPDNRCSEGNRCLPKAHRPNLYLRNPEMDPSDRQMVSVYSSKTSKSRDTMEKEQLLQVKGG
jgi:hypothetical protein